LAGGAEQDFEGNTTTMYKLLSCKADGPLTTYQQQVCHWSCQGINTCPKEQFLLNLEKHIAQCQDKGDQIILMTDMNKDEQATQLKGFCNKVNLLSQRHCTSTWLSKTPIHQCGSKAKDGIFLSEGLLEEAKGSFLKFGEATISNHQAIWLHTRTAFRIP